jgi:pimeloyl-ACP methyl ester carboxylesterase
LLLAATVVVGLCLALRPLAAVRVGSRLLWAVTGVADRTAEIRGDRLHWIEAGEGPGVVLLHGLRGEAGVWSRVLPPLARRGWRVAAPDLPGYGSSATGDLPVTLAGEVDQVTAWLEHWSPGQPIALVGNSMGGWLALRLALAYPERVFALALVDSAGLVFDPPPSHLLVARRREDLEANLPMIFQHPPPVPGVLLNALARRDPRVSLDLLADMRSGRNQVEDLLGAITVPTQVLWGREDRLIPLGVGRDLADRIPGARLVVLDGAGHLPMFDRPKVFVETLGSFLEEVR